MLVIDDYIPVDLDFDNTYHHIALEGAIRAIEDDLNVPPYIASHFIDLRAMEHVESLRALRELVESPGFEVDVVRQADRQPTYTLYGRAVRRGFSTNHLMVQCTKGWIVLGHVRTNYSRD